MSPTHLASTCFQDPRGTLIAEFAYRYVDGLPPLSCSLPLMCIIMVVCVRSWVQATSAEFLCEHKFDFNKVMLV